MNFFHICRLGETCSHVAAVLYKIEAAVRIGMTNVTPTDLPCQWNQTFTKTIDGARVKDIDIYSSKAKKNISMESKEKDIDSPYSDFSEFLSNVSRDDPKTVALSLFETYQEHFVWVSEKDSNSEITTLIPSLRSYYRPENAGLSETEYDLLARETMNLIKAHSSAQYTYVEEATRNQSQSIVWYKQRAGRITGSRIFGAYNSTIEKPSKTTILGICSEKHIVLNVPPIQWGREHEATAISLYTEIFSNPGFVTNTLPLNDCFLHENLQVQPIGLVISE